MKHFSFFAFIFLVISSASMGQPPARIGIAGLSHSHVVLLLRNLDREDIQIVGIAESNADLPGYAVIKSKLLKP